MILQAELSTADVIEALHNLDDSCKLCSLMLNHPQENQLSIYYRSFERGFIHRIVHPSGETEERPLVEKEGTARDDEIS